MVEVAFKELVQVLKDAEEDVIKGYGGNRAAATRARKALMRARDLVNTTRTELLDAGKGPDNGGVAPREVTATLDVLE